MNTIQYPGQGPTYNIRGEDIKQRPIQPQPQEVSGEIEQVKDQYGQLISGLSALLECIEKRLHSILTPIPEALGSATPQEIQSSSPLARDLECLNMQFEHHVSRIRRLHSQIAL